MLRRILSGLSLALLCIPASLPTLAQDQVRVARSTDGSTVKLAGPEDPANPYRGQYSAYDLWIWEHYAPLPSELAAGMPGGQALR